MEIDYPLLIDGGLSNALEGQGLELDHPLWSARLLDSNPEAIVQAHLAYLEAGARCIITSSYQATIPGFLNSGYSQKQAETLILKTVELAERAIGIFLSNHEVPNKPLIAASIGPYGAYLADGSEYHGKYAISSDDLRSFHLGRMKMLARSNADFFACETIPSYQEAKVLAEILESINKPAWVSFTCQNEQQLRDGTTIEKCISLFSNHDNVFAIGINCTAPEYISGLIKRITILSADKKVLVYPNSGELYDAQTKTWCTTSEPASFSQLAQEWISLGADIIGGCCRIGPTHIQSLYKELRK